MSSCYLKNFRLRFFLYAFTIVFCAANPHHRTGEKQHPWRTTLVQSLMCYTLIEVYRTPTCKKPHANTFVVRTWDLTLPQPSRTLITDPGRKLLCHFSKTVLRTPSYPWRGVSKFIFESLPMYFPDTFPCWNLHILITSSQYTYGYRVQSQQR